MWGMMREWLKTASIPQDRLLKADLIGPLKRINSGGAIALEGKKEMKARGLASPDAADAIAVTFAYPVANRDIRDAAIKRRTSSYSSSNTSTGWMGA